MNTDASRAWAAPPCVALILPRECKSHKSSKRYSWCTTKAGIEVCHILFDHEYRLSIITLQQEVMWRRSDERYKSEYGQACFPRRRGSAFLRKHANEMETAPLLTVIYLIWISMMNVIALFNAEIGANTYNESGGKAKLHFIAPKIAWN